MPSFSRFTPVVNSLTANLWVLFLVALLIPLAISAIENDNTSSQFPLDLPSGGGASDDEEEDAPETIIFYGQNYEGDAFFWTLDKSGSMGWNGEIEVLKQEVTQAVMSLSSAAEFSLVAFSSGHILWSAQPRRATSQNKASASAWVGQLHADGWTCLAPAVIETLNICNQSHKQQRQIIVLSDGAPVCNGIDTSSSALNEITTSNWQQVPIHTIFIGNEAGGLGFMQELALLNGGTSTFIDP
ncbi:MAG TPA: hypothetical protein EYN79_04655 [Planctomycetes bacterium]|nr:hypothetical protein [Planctomycetota bacterium]HIN79557.1 hypothetical protein [Planctomycetota bacterium]